MRDISFCPLLWTSALGLHPAPLNLVIYIAGTVNTQYGKAFFASMLGAFAAAGGFIVTGPERVLWRCLACSTSWVSCCFPVAKAAFLCGLV